jgi:hypothetical protein
MIVEGILKCDGWSQVIFTSMSFCETRCVLTVKTILPPSVTSCAVVEMVKEGYAYYGDNGPLKDLYSGDIYYSTYFDYAYLYAQKSGIRIHGEKDPNFDY